MKEHMHRFDVFQNTLQVIDARNKAEKESGGSAGSFERKGQGRRGVCRQGPRRSTVCLGAACQGANSGGRFPHGRERQGQKVSCAHEEEEKEAGGSARHGVTRFADLTQEEFEAMYLDSRTSKNIRQRNATVIATPRGQTSGAVDYTGSQTTAVKDQGSCGRLVFLKLMTVFVNSLSL